MASDRDESSDPVGAIRAITRQAMRPDLGHGSSKTESLPRRRSLAPLIWVVPPVVLGAAFLLLAGHTPAPAPPPERATSPATTTATVPVGQPADEAALLVMPAIDTHAYPFAPAPAILVLLYPTMHAQALAMNRIGAFVEKTGLPRDHVLNDAALDSAIAASGDQFDGYYFGHDYRAADLARFFAIAQQDNITLRPEEQALHTMLLQRGMLENGATGAIITLPPFATDPQVDAAARATILRHELSHGLYFTDPAYAAYTQSFWQTNMTEAQRELFRTFLGHEGYDITNDDLIRNETQAYLAHTADPRFFNPDSVGIGAAALATLRRDFVTGMPAGWLRDRTDAQK